MPAVRALTDITVYETRLRFYFVGHDPATDLYRILKVDRTTPLRDNLVTEDEAIYTPSQLQDLLVMIGEGNKQSGGLKKLMQASGIVGFVRFLEGFYVLMITQASVVAVIGSHKVFQIDDTRLISIAAPGVKSDRSADEQRYMDVFCSMDLTKNFYFSPTYDITHSFQYNCLRSDTDGGDEFMDMFVWNHFLLSMAFHKVSNQSPWILPIIYGFIQQSKISVIGRPLILTLIGRRSRQFAGARFLKRGVNAEGYVANDVETEQIITDASHAGRNQLQARCTSFVQHRGSIPLYWSQETSNMAPKPPIQINFRDPFYAATALHFDNLLMRYHSPIVVLNLVKHRETHRRESILLDEYTEAVTYLNQFLPVEKRIRYIAFDMSRAAKSPGQDVIGILEKLAERALSQTGFFNSVVHPATLASDGEEEFYQNSRRPRSRIQSGVIRTNCIDCLDRTNAAQFVIGKSAMAHQLHALGLIDEPYLPLDCDATKILMEMYHDHGDIIALQYGGSALVNTMETYQKTTDWTSQSRDMLETIKRYYSNSFTDAEKQNAINVFLGNFTTGANHPEPEWSTERDVTLHRVGHDSVLKPSYVNWYHPQHLEVNGATPSAATTTRHYYGLRETFEHCYNPKRMTSFQDSFLCNMFEHNRDPGDPTASPFHVRGDGRPLRKFKLAVVPTVPSDDDNASAKSAHGKSSNGGNGGSTRPVPHNATGALALKLLQAQVSAEESEEYARYVHQFDSDRFQPAASSTAGTDGDNSKRTTDSLNIDHPAHYAYYAEYLARNESLSGMDERGGIDPKDLLIYENHVAVAKKPAPSLTARTAQHDAYRRWLEKGRFAVG